MCSAGRSPRRRSTSVAVRCGAVVSARRRVSRCVSGWSGSAAVRRSSRSRGRPAGGSWSGEIERAGQRAHLADPAETAAKRGRKRRAKTDNADCDLQLRLLLAGELPESWIPPAQILELRTRVRMRKTLIDQRTAWQQRLQAQLFHQGIPAGLRLRSQAGRDALAQAELSPAGRELVALRLRLIDAPDRALAPLDPELRAVAPRPRGSRAF